MIRTEAKFLECLKTKNWSGIKLIDVELDTHLEMNILCIPDCVSFRLKFPGHILFLCLPKAETVLCNDCNIMVFQIKRCILFQNDNNKILSSLKLKKAKYIRCNYCPILENVKAPKCIEYKGCFSGTKNLTLDNAREIICVNCPLEKYFCPKSEIFVT